MQQEQQVKAHPLFVLTDVVVVGAHGAWYKAGVLIYKRALYEEMLCNVVRRRNAPTVLMTQFKKTYPQRLLPLPHQVAVQPAAAAVAVLRGSRVGVGDNAIHSLR